MLHLVRQQLSNLGDAVEDAPFSVRDQRSCLILAAQLLVRSRAYSVFEARFRGEMMYYQKPDY